MNEETDPKLKALFAAYAPVLGEEAFLARTREAIVRQQHRARIRWTAICATLILACGGIAFATWPIINGWLSLLDDGLLRWTNALSPLATQLLIYGLTAAMALLGRHRIRAFLAPW